ncbi:MAG: metallophosphoesterase [Candidatus Thermoplasmatota archaeon]|nr:metallophosphoesterase [Candidatus Thermoplasmatota archaeon]
MGGLLAVCDVHEGINFGFRVDPETGISERSLDLHRNFARTAEYAIENRVDLFVVGGDLFDRTHVSPSFRELVRRDVIEPLGRAGIKTWVVAGNHDQPRQWSRGTSLDDLRGYPHVKVFREPTVKEAVIDGKTVTFLILPYLHPEHIADRVRERLGEEVPREQTFELGRRMLKEWMRRRVEEAKGEHVLMLGHYYVEGAKVRSTAYPEVLPGEFSFTLDMIPSVVELAIFGHIHLHQVLGDRVVYVGAPERVDWGERGDPKGFVTYSPGEGWSFHPLPTRPMVKVEVDATGGDPTGQVMEALQQGLRDALVRLEIQLEEGQRELLDEALIAERLSEAFHYELSLSYTDRERISLEEFTLDPLRLFEEYVKLNYGDHTRLEDILSEGEAILREVLS